MTIALNELPAEDFESLVQQPLTARAGDRELALTLESVWRSSRLGRTPVPGALRLPGLLD